MPSPKVQQKKKVKDLTPRKNQKCFSCKKEIKGAWCYNGHWWHEKCSYAHTAKRVKDYIKSVNIKTK